MFRFQDQTGRKIEFDDVPKRIVSLVPSQTELLFDLGLEKHIVGITKFCIFPKNKVNRISQVGGTKSVNLEKIRQMQPDLIIGNKEENTEKDILLLEKEYPVWLSDITTIDDALNMIAQIGELTTQSSRARELILNIGQEIESWKKYRKNTRKDAIYLIWKDPVMAVGNGTFIHSMMELLGLRNVVADVARYPELSNEMMARLQPDIVLLSSEPYPFKVKHLKEFQMLWPKSRIHLVDATYFSWYGSRMLHAPHYFHKLAPLLNEL